MVIEQFSRKVLNSGVLDTFVATGFFSILIFFTLNSYLYTPLEMMFGTVLVTIAFKGVSNMMFSLIILLFDLENAQAEQELKIAEDKLDLLLNEMKMTEARLKSEKSNANI